MKFFDSLKFPQKMSLVVFSFLLPIGVLLYHVVYRYNFEAQWSRQESYGNKYQRPLEGLLKLVPEHGFMAARYAHSKNADIKDALGGKQVEIDKAFDRLAQADSQVGTNLEFTDAGLGKRKRLHFKVNTVRSEWDSLKSGWAAMSPEALADKHSHLVADIKTMIVHSGDTSLLILDPDLDSYYLMDITLLALPQTQDRLIGITQTGWDILRTKGDRPLNRAERTQFATWSAQLRELDLVRIEGDVATVLNEDAQFYGVLETVQNNLPAAFAGYKAKTEDFLKLLDKMVANPALSVAPQEYVAAAATAREASFSFWDRAVDAHDAFMFHRIGYFNGKRNQAVASTAVALAVSLIIAFFITNSITTPFKQIYDVLTGQASLNFSQKLDIDSTDEFGEMGQQINSSVEKLRSTIQEIMKSSGALGEAAMSWATVISEDMAKKGASSSMKEMEGSVTEVAASSSELSDLAGKFKI
jgi:hypothetical protein